MGSRLPSSPTASSKHAEVRLPASCDPPDEDRPAQRKVWLIFGSTGHMGRSLVRTALQHDDQVAAVGRTLENTQAQMDGWHPECLGLLCDVRVRQTVDAAIQRAIKHFGRIDIIANCTGYGIIAAAEDQSDYDLHDQFETNFLGTLHILQLSLPYFRTNKIPGRYLIFSSTAGALGIPGLAPYCATKYAVEGLIESMLYETHVFNIKATLVEPGHVRLDEREKEPGPPIPESSQIQISIPTNQALEPPTNANIAPQHRLKRYGHLFVKPNPSPPYASPTHPAGHARRTVQWLDEFQPTSAVKSAELVWQLGHCSYPPLRLLLGSFAVESIRDRLKSITEEIEDWKHLSFGHATNGGGRGSAGETRASGTDEEHGDAEASSAPAVKSEEMEGDLDDEGLEDMDDPGESELDADFELDTEGSMQMDAV